MYEIIHLKCSPHDRASMCGIGGFQRSSEKEGGLMCSSHVTSAMFHVAVVCP